MKFMKLGSKPDSFQSDGINTRYVATELASDFVVNIGDIKFYLHKFPLLSKCARLQMLLAQNNDENKDVYISDIPGGASTFELCAKFCYGMTVTLNAYNVVAARCAAEYLEMHEDMEKGNLIYKIEVFLNNSIARSWKDSIIVLQACKYLFPWSEELKVVVHCVDSISSMASIEPSKVDWSYSYNRKKLSHENNTDSHWNGVQRQVKVPKDWWVEDLCELEIDFYKRVIVAIKSKRRVPSELVGEALKAYALRWLPAFGKDQIHGSEATRRRSLVETIVWLLPSEKGSVSCAFLLKCLKAGILLDTSDMAKRELVKRIGKQLDQACSADLLMPAPGTENGMYDVDLVQNIIREFLIQDRCTKTSHPILQNELLPDDIHSIEPTSVSNASKIAVGKVVDGYLVEISHDPNLPLTKFVELVQILPDAARPVHDGLYRAIDMYLKEHPAITKSEKKKLCRLMDCKRLSTDACMHAAQNDQLPLRVVVQVLFFEQVRAGGGTGADLPGTLKSLLPPESGEPRHSSRSAATNLDSDWDASTMKSEELRSIKGELAVLRISGDRRNGIRSKDAEKVNRKVRGVLKSKKIFNKLWSTKDKADYSGSDTSECPSSVNPTETKSTASKSGRRSIS